MEQLRVVIEERVRARDWHEPDAIIYHLREGIGDGDFQAVKCGGGIVMPGNPVKVPRSQVCPDCLSGRTTL